MKSPHTLNIATRAVKKDFSPDMYPDIVNNVSFAFVNDEFYFLRLPLTTLYSLR